jgi:hypothetical protein
MRQLQAELDAQQAALAAARKALDEEKAASEAKIAADAKAHRERVAKDNAELNERLAELDARSKILHAEREELKKQQAAVTPASRNENETYARAFAGNQPVVELPAAPSRNKTARRSVVESDGQPELNAAQQLRQNEVVESLHGRLLKEAEAAAKEAARLEDDRRRVEEVERRSAEAKRAQAELEQRQADERRLAQEDNRRQAEARRLQAEPQGHTGPVDHVQLEALNTTRDHTAATYAAVLKCRTFVDYRIMVLTIIAAPHDGTLQFYGLKRTDTPPSRSLLATNADFTSFVQYLESIGTRPSETVVEWEWVGLPDASRRAPETSVVSCQLDPGPQRTVHTDASAGLPATVPVLKDAYLAQPSRPSVLLHELPQPALRSARYVRCRHTRLGTVYHIPFTVEYPPSFWLLQQQCAHYFDIPERFLQLHFTCDGIPNVLSVVTDTDVLGVASLSLEPNATLHIVDGRM